MYRIIRILDIAKKRIRELEDGFKVSIQIMSKIEKRGKRKTHLPLGSLLQEDCSNQESK